MKVCGITKAALLALTSTWAAQVADTPIFVNAVCPGLTATFEGAEQMGARPAAQGAESVMWAVRLPVMVPEAASSVTASPFPVCRAQTEVLGVAA